MPALVPNGGTPFLAQPPPARPARPWRLSARRRPASRGPPGMASSSRRCALASSARFWRFVPPQDTWPGDLRGCPRIQLLTFYGANTNWVKSV